VKTIEKEGIQGRGKHVNAWKLIRGKKKANLTTYLGSNRRARNKSSLWIGGVSEISRPEENRAGEIGPGRRERKWQSDYREDPTVVPDIKCYCKRKRG